MWEERFSNWAGPLSDTEDEKCTNAINVVRKAIQADNYLRTQNLSIFAQGSYKANTNVKADSDVDICVCNRDFFFTTYPLGVTDQHLGNVPAGIEFRDFKNLIGTALNNRFGSERVARGNKSFRISENTYHIKADVVPTYEYRLYKQIGGNYIFDKGVAFLPDTGNRIVNWPEQTLANGIEKNSQTGKRYKKVVRILKALRNEMETKNNSNAKEVSSFMIESLAWNVANTYYGNNDLYSDVTGVANDIWYRTYDESRCLPLKEINGINILFTPDRLLKRAKISGFFWDVQYYIGARN